MLITILNFLTYEKFYTIENRN